MKNIYENKILKPICSKSFQRGSSQISFCGIHAIFPSPSLRFSLPITRAGLPLSGFHFSLTPYLRLSPSFSSSKSTAAPPISACCRKSRRSPSFPKRRSAAAADGDQKNSGFLGLGFPAIVPCGGFGGF